MGVRSAIYNRAKIGLQSALGTGVTPTLILNSLGFGRPKPVLRGGFMHTNNGEQFASASVPASKSHTELACEGILTFNAINYVFATLFGNVSVTADGTNGKKRDFYLANGLSITKKYLTVEVGDANRAKKVIDAFAKGLTITLSDKEQKVSMPFLGANRQDDTTPTTSATEVTPSIVDPAKFDVFVADTYAALATQESGGSANRFPLPLMAELNIPDISGVLYRMNSGDSSFTGTVDLKNQPTLKFKTGDDDNDFGALLPLIASGATKFFRIVALGAAIAGVAASQERFAIDFCGKLITPEEPDEEDGASSNTFTFQAVHDPTSGKVLNIQTISTLAAF